MVPLCEETTMNTTKEYGIWCQVSGGVTGHRQAWLKANGKVQTFATLAEAEAEAERLTGLRRYDSQSATRYHYAPMLLFPWLHT